MSDEINPIAFKLELTKWDWFKTILFGIILWPLRFLSFAFVFTSFWIWALLRKAVLPVPKDGLTTRERDWLAWLTRMLTYSCGIVVTVKGELCSAEESRILVAAPHSTLFDLFIFGGWTRYPIGMAKEFLSNVPMLGTILRQSHFFFAPNVPKKSEPGVIVDPIRDELDALDATSVGVDKGRKLILAAEGTNGNRKGGNLKPTFYSFRKHRGIIHIKHFSHVTIQNWSFQSWIGGSTHGHHF